MTEHAVTERVSVGLLGAGPWAQMVHAPVLAAGPETRLVGVWARREEAATELAQRHGATPFTRVEDLFDACEAVAICVPPAVQAELAVAAAAAGKPVLLEKPIAESVAGAEGVVAALDEAGVGSVVVLTYRFAPVVRDFLERARGFGAVGGRGCFISGAFLGGAFASSPWRQERGALLDVGPHVVDLMDAALGPVVDVTAGGERKGWVSLLLTHESGATSDVSLCCTAAIEPSRTEIELYGPNGVLAVDARAGTRGDAFANVRAELARVARGGRSDVDAHRGLHIQRILDRADAQLR